MERGQRHALVAPSQATGVRRSGRLVPTHYNRLARGPGCGRPPRVHAPGPPGIHSGLARQERERVNPAVAANDLDVEVDSGAVTGIAHQGDELPPLDELAHGHASDREQVAIAKIPSSLERTSRSPARAVRTVPD